MRLAPLARRPLALLAATALLTTAGVGSGLLTGTAYADVTITTVTNPVNAGNQTNVVVTGTGAEPGEPLTITITDGTVTVPPTQNQTVLADPQTGDYTKAINVDSLDDGVLTVTVESTVSGTATRPIVKDTVAPAAPTALTTDPTTRVNASQQGSVTVTATTAADAAALRLSIRDVNGVQITRYHGAGPGTFTSVIDVTTLAQGTLTVTAASRDAAGNEALTTKTLTKDSLAPNAPTYAFAGVLASPNRVNVASPGTGNSLTVTLTTNEASTFFTTVTDSAGLVRTFAPTSTTPATSNSIVVEPYQFADGTLTFSTVATDAALNAGPAGTSTVLKDVTAPSITDLKITPSPVNNASQGAVVVTGKVVRSASLSTLPSESGTSVRIDPSCPVFAGTPPLLLDADSEPEPQTVSIAADGTFTATFNASDCIDGDLNLTIDARATDPGGNVSALATTKATVDTVAPNAPVVAALANAVNSNLTAVPFSGTAEIGSLVKVTIKDSGTGSVLVEVMANDSGAFSGTAPLTTLADGTISATATATDGAGNTGAVSSARTASKDTTTFALVTATPTGTTGPGSTVQATYNEPLSLASSSINVKTNPGNVPVPGTTSYANGNKTIIFTPTAPFATGSYVATIVGKESGVGNDPAITTILNFTVDAAAPSAPVITTLTNPVNNANKAAVHAVGTAEAGATVKVTLSNGAANVIGTQVAAGNGTFDITLDATTLPDGTLTAVATATDASNNVSANSGAKTATKDTVVPTVTGVNATDTTQASPSTTVTGTASESGIAVKVTLTDKNASTFVADTTSGSGGAISVVIATGTLADGPITASVVATDVAGNPSAPATKTFTKDVTGPSITGLAATDVNIAAAGKTTVSGSIGEPGSVTVSVTDGTTTKSGTGTAAADGSFSVVVDVSTLTDGTLTVTVVGKDARGNSGPSSGRTVAKDTVKPAVTGLAATATTGASPITTVSGSTEALASVVLTITDGVKTDTKTVNANGSGAFSTTFDLTGYKSGSLPVTAKATDGAGNVGDTANATATRDATGPTITALAATATKASTPASTVTGTVDDPKATIALKATDKNGLTKTGSATVAGDGSFSGSLDLSTLADGAITVEAKGTDLAGNVGTAVTTTTSKDATAPVITGLAATNSTAASPSTSVTGNVDDKTATVALKATDKNGLTKTGTATVNASTGAFTGSLDLSTLATGPITVEAKGTDTVGNVGTPATVTITRDTVGPVITGLAATATTASQPSSTVTGTVDDTAATVGLVATDSNGLTKTGSATVNPATGAFTASLDLSTLADGAITVAATATDAAGNTGTASVLTSKDGTAPVISGLAATAPTVSQPSTSVTGNVDDKTATVALKATDKNGLTKTGTATVNASTGAFTGSLDLSTLAAGAITVEAKGTDTVGNVGAPATVTINKDGTAPVITGLTATASTPSQPSSTVNGTVDDKGASVAILATDSNGATKSATAAVNPSTGAFTASVDLSTLAEGTITVRATATDAAGNTGTATTTTTRTNPAVTFVDLTPSRVLDTRSGNGAPAAAVGPAGVVQLQVTGRGGVPSTGVSAVVLNVTVTGPTKTGFLTAYPNGTTRPTASNLNFVEGRTVANLVVVPVGADGKVALFNGSPGTVDMLADVAGYFTTGSSASPGAFGALAPSRLLDTRSGNGAPAAAVGPTGVVQLQVTGRGGVPSTGVSAVVLNVTVTGPTKTGFLTAYPNGTTRPTASNLNFAAGQTVANLVIVPVGADGKVALFNGSQGTVDMLADVAGYYSSGTPTTTGAFAALAPSRVLDTRSGNGAPDAAVGPTGVVQLQVTGRGGVPSTGVSAVVLNVTVTGPTKTGFLTAYPNGTTRPTASNLNFATGQTVPNLVIVPVGADGKVALFNGSQGTVDMLADVAGYYLS